MADGALEDIQATLASVAPAILLIKGINDSNGTAANAELVQKAQLVVNRVVLKLQASALAVDQSGRLSSRLWTIAGDDMTGVPNEEVWTLPVVVTDMDRDVLLSALENMSTLRTVFAGKRKAEPDVDDEVAVVNNIKNSFRPSALWKAVTASTTTCAACFRSLASTLSRCGRTMT